MKTAVINAADYALTPHMAIVDPQLVMHMPPKLTAWGGIDALTHALESYVSVCATGGWAGGSHPDPSSAHHAAHTRPVGCIAVCVASWIQMDWIPP